MTFALLVLLVPALVLSAALVLRGVLRDGGVLRSDGDCGCGRCGTRGRERR